MNDGSSQGDWQFWIDWVDTYFPSISTGLIVLIF